MIDEKTAYAIASSAKPFSKFTGDCVDYKGCWVFPYEEPGNDSFFNAGCRVFVDKETGLAMLSDPTFDIELWNSSENRKGKFSTAPGEKAAKFFRALRGDKMAVETGKDDTKRIRYLKMW